MKNVWVLIGYLCLCITMQAQASNKMAFDAGSDIKSRYVWRGMLFCDAPCVQPYMSVNWHGLTAMVWGAYATSKNYAEVDLFLSYNIGAFTFNLNDFYTEDERDMSANDFTQWNDSLTNHLVETSVVYTMSSDVFPMSLTLSSIIYGPDKDEQKNQNYSSYLEASLPFKVNTYSLSVFCGATLFKGFYASSAGVINVGVNSSYNLRLSEKYSIPVNLELSVNPKKRDLFFVAGISL